MAKKSPKKTAGGAKTNIEARSAKAESPMAARVRAAWERIEARLGDPSALREGLSPDDPARQVVGDIFDIDLPDALWQALLVHDGEERAAICPPRRLLSFAEMIDATSAEQRAREEEHATQATKKKVRPRKVDPRCNGGAAYFLVLTTADAKGAKLMLDFEPSHEGTNAQVIEESPGAVAWIAPGFAVWLESHAG